MAESHRYASRYLPLALFTRARHVYASNGLIFLDYGDTYLALDEADLTPTFVLHSSPGLRFYSVAHSHGTVLAVIEREGQGETKTYALAVFSTARPPRDPTDADRLEIIFEDVGEPPIVKPTGNPDAPFILYPSPIGDDVLLVTADLDLVKFTHRGTRFSPSLAHAPCIEGLCAIPAKHRSEGRVVVLDTREMAERYTLYGLPDIPTYAVPLVDREGNLGAIAVANNDAYASLLVKGDNTLYHGVVRVDAVSNKGSCSPMCLFALSYLCTDYILIEPPFGDLRKLMERPGYEEENPVFGLYAYKPFYYTF